MLLPFKLSVLLSLSALDLFKGAESVTTDTTSSPSTSTISTGAGAGAAKCPVAGTYPTPIEIAAINNDQCTNCPFPLYSESGCDICNFCREGFYLNDTVNITMLMEKPLDFCLECPIGADCTEAGSTLLELPIKQGYWRHSKETEKIYRCKNQRNRKENNHICKGYPHGDVHSLQSEDIGNMYCDANHKGPLCEVCVSDAEFFNPEEGRCEECPSTGKYVGYLFIVLVVALFVIAIIWILLKRFPMRREMFQAKFKILVGFFQVISSYEIVYGVELADNIQDYFEFLTRFHLDFLHSQRNCIGGEITTYILNACRPYILCALLITLLLFFVMFSERSNEWTNIKTQFGRQAPYIAVVVFYFTVPYVSRDIFDARRCRAFRTIDAAEDGYKRYLLFALEVECDVNEDEEYKRLMAWFWTFFVLWPCLVPVVFLVLLAVVKRSVKESRPTALAKSCRFLWEDFDETSSIALYWDVIDTFRKIFLNGLINFVDEQQGFSKVLRLSVACAVSTMYLAFLVIVQPYKRKEDLYFSTISSFLLVIVFGLGDVLHICGKDKVKCTDLVGGLDANTAAIAIGILVVAMIGITIWFMCSRKYRAPIVRLKSTKNLPNLEMLPSHMYHVFMSHVWSTGQDKTHAIARSLQLHLPKLKVWLDVDSLDDVDRLEEYIAQSAVIVIFYSKGYFRSKNCRREFYKAFEMKKPMILLYNGGVSVVEEMKEECRTQCENDESRPESTSVSDLLDILTSDGPICWLKEGSFSLESLKLVYLRVFRNLPFYQDTSRRRQLDKGFYLPSDVGSAPLSSSVQLLYCEENVGAFELAKEIEAKCPDNITIERAVVEEEQMAEENSVKSVLDVFPITGTFPVVGIDDIEDGLLFTTARTNDLIDLVDIVEGSQKQVLLLYLNKNTFGDGNDCVAKVVKSASEKKIDIILVHEQDAEKDACPFGDFFTLTPQELIDRPHTIYKDIAIPLYTLEEYRNISLQMIMQDIEGEKEKKGRMRFFIKSC